MSVTVVFHHHASSKYLHDCNRGKPFSLFSIHPLSLYTNRKGEARRQLSIITTLVGKEYYDNSEQSYEGSYRRLKYVGYETKCFLILTFLREVSNVLPIPWDPLIPFMEGFIWGILFCNED
ncbi:PREDICTED: uncharacterized protein LOC106326078 [Brassica oleracea var. oleracea]|uniref:uncharacterized protein LOC106326078 n=1 Tax=Brassica oleracea var. oleracea TaxID=109376 RepID=UPI0006A6E513|nr:PREDICTED: uncharacterized protein LOC106326078 [Brassica oleracea var. oleracea]